MKRAAAGILVCSAFFLLLNVAGGHALAKSTKEVLLMADEARGNRSGMEWEVTVSSVEKGRQNEMVYNVKARGFDILAVSLSPPNDKGNAILMLNGSMWFHKPGLSKAVPITQRQKLLGNAAYGDIAATNYANEYKALLLGEETEGDEVCYVYDLKAIEKKATYDGIKYWVSQQRLVGIKAEYFTVSGKPFKTATMEYENNIQTEGKARPFISKMHIRDVLLTTDHTILTFNKANMREIPDHIFNLNLLVK